MRRTAGSGRQWKLKNLEPPSKGGSLIRLVICNQRGGVGKTTTAVTLARCFADRGKRTLILDLDSQGSVATLLGLKPNHFVYHFLIEKRNLRECVAHIEGLPAPLDILCGNRMTNEAELMLNNQVLREFVISQLMMEPEQDYDVVLVDVAPSISLFQNCASVYCQNTVIPVDMDVLSIQGAFATMHAEQMLREMLIQARPHVPSRIVGFLPLKVHRGLQATSHVMRSLEKMAREWDIPVLPAVRTDQAVLRASRKRTFLADIEPKSKALEDYSTLADHILTLFEEQHGNVEAIATPAQV